MQRKFFLMLAICLTSSAAWSSGHSAVCRSELLDSRGQNVASFVGEDETWLGACQQASAQCWASAEAFGKVCLNEAETNAIVHAGDTVVEMAIHILDGDARISVLPNGDAYRVVVDFSDCVTRLEYDAAGTLLKKSRRRCD